MEKERKNCIKSAYDKAADVYSRKFFYELYSKPLVVKLLDLFVERVNPNGLICEIGCGPGEISTYLKYKGLDIIGIDLSEKMIENAKSLNPEIDYHVGDVFNLSFSDNAFTGVLAPFLIVNFTMEEIEEAVKEIKRVLVPEGLFFFSFHTGIEVQTVESFFVDNNKLDFHLHSIEVLEEVMAKHDFEILEWIIRAPYKEMEAPTKRAYFFARNNKK